ncbi:MAG TPA: hypothetical protein PKO38_04855 [Bacillota bacterium]|jgi:hypothetical protein|nr:hypothetical protein [Bacillota bacterium]HOP69413.1 hypothetical protein [Bacillota bacterium]HPT34381.1 hypothetical protein [Bacillota bacterium]HQD06642.1 hypothetical protein [Bacillota bacterium]
MIFESTAKMYDVLGELFNELMKDQPLYQKFIDSDITIRFNISDPDGYIWLTRDGKVICGEADYKPTIEMTLSGDTCHKFWLQEIKMPVALAKGLIKAKGPLPKVLNLLPLIKPAYVIYPDIAKKHGIL